MGQRLTEIVCVDDDLDSLKLRARFLDSLGYSVTSCSDPEQALRIVRSRPVDAVVMDYQMPGMNGGEAALEIKRLRPQVPVLIVSGLEALPDDAPREAIDEFVSKREPLAAVAAALERVLQRAEPKELSGAELAATAAGMLVQRLVYLIRRHKTAEC